MTEETHELALTRLIAAPRHALWRCWTEPELIKRWFTPRPWTTPVAEVDVRPGGASDMVFRGPDGEEFPNRGVYLEVVPDERLVFTDAYTAGWIPSAKPFMTGIITFADEGGATRYTALARHWTAEDRARHEDMGFHDGWGRATDQLETLARSL
jgi:uncharacterized protein YndB with AHSA1/START domain